MTHERAQYWQRNPENLKTEKVQYWTKSGVMLTAMMARVTAQELVRSGFAFVISDQAIGEFDESGHVDKMYSLEDIKKG